MIKKIKIENFKSIHDLELELGRVNLFLGSNGSGKTNILEALGVISAAVLGVVDDEALLRRGVRPGVPRLYKTSSQKYNISAHISFTAESETCNYRVALLNPLDRPRPQWNYKTESFSSKELESGYTRGVRKNPNPMIGGMPAVMAQIEMGSQTDLFLKALREYAIYNPNTPALRGLVPDQQTRLPVGLSGGSLAEGLQSLKASARNDEDLEDIIDEVIGLFDWVENVASSSSISQILSASLPRAKKTITFTDRYMKKKYNKLTATDASEGVLYALFLMVLCLTKEGPSLFSIDNIDQALNPRLVKKLVGLLQGWFTNIIPGKQILCTAHNPSILDGFDLHSAQVKLFVVDRDSDGLTVANPVVITEELIQLSQKNNLPLSRLWLEGYLGGVPNV